jgi:hypothetical protein
LLVFFFIFFFILVPLVTLTFLPTIALLAGLMFPLRVALYLGSGRNPWSFLQHSPARHAEADQKARGRRDSRQN